MDTDMESIHTEVDVECDISSNCSLDKDFYKRAQQYWSEVPATVNGMLGGMGYISAIDIQSSGNFLRDLKTLGTKYALDCGAGIGRVTKNLLMPRFDVVDLVEQDSAFATKAKEYCTMDSGNTLGFPNRLGTIYNVGLQMFTPDCNKYDLIWSQWVLGHLTDEDLLTFFQRVRIGLAKGGYFVIKENVTSTKEVEKDEQDSSVTRPLKVYEDTLRLAEFRILRITRQQSFPKGLYPVYMIASRPISYFEKPQNIH
ncbi:alpha N-terminal protein methyltransferase 1-like [Teleopsis dalmanni]|uniref:alpha N-terminal protein methyltransferase 1-like n=1 Tax=Teleopsis dalmanni TaxID=139649 RepID=UPI0018CD937D|nr:alpha N-terminal protein methyltransferase 1-like [Teleopsis dalmanni]XP_037948579.1 alpha N-terminal protein methyltransferase 1-like [Teleopsis dalmanni]XP_037948580.1 alpha N-terminal protein methyltransferase 1-like [Teleopsis dalmanni]